MTNNLKVGYLRLVLSLLVVSLFWRGELQVILAGSLANPSGIECCDYTGIISYKCNDVHVCKCKDAAHKLLTVILFGILITSWPNFSGIFAASILH